MNDLPPKRKLTNVPYISVSWDELPIYDGDLISWRPGLPTLLADREHFVCYSCRESRHLVDDLRYLWRKRPYPLPDENTVCDECYKADADMIDSERTRLKQLRARRRGH